MAFRYECMLDYTPSIFRRSADFREVAGTMQTHGAVSRMTSYGVAGAAGAGAFES